MRVFSTTLLLALATAPSLAVAGTPLIKIVEAKWSGKDVSGIVADRCKGRSSTTYKVSRSYIGEPANSSDLSFKLRWKCEDGYPKEEQVVSVREGSLITIECTENPAAPESKEPAVKGPALVNYPNGKVPGLDPLQKSKDTEKLLRYPYSFHQMLLDPTHDNFEKSLTPQCVTQLRDYLVGGHTFYVPELVQATVPADKFGRSHPEYGFRYFHRTQSPIVPELAKNQDFDSMYRFLRQQTRSYYIHLAEIFVADHPTSMDRSGQYLIEITSKPDAKILSFPSANHPVEFTTKLQGLVGPWIKSQHPELSDCYQSGTVDQQFTGNAIDYLALEASGVGWASHGTYSGSQYLFITNPFTIQTMAPSPLQ